MKKIEIKYNVSRETMDKLKTYEASLFEWQNRFNLVSNSSLEDAWNRHFLDSMQLCDYIPKDAETLCDFGSGAGFPGMVLAIMAVGRTPYLKVTLVESIRKKTLYLKEVAKLTSVDVEILNDRIENLPNKKFDVITSRAMTSLSGLLSYAKRFCHKDSVCIFPKGRSYLEEIAEAQKTWMFDCQIKDNKQSEEGKILVIRNISKRRENSNA